MKKSISVFLSFCIVLATLMSGLVTAFAEGNAIEGSNVTWSFNPETGELSFEGEGSIYDYDDYTNDKGDIELKYPWKDVEYTSIVFGKDITGIGDYAFCYSSKLKSVVIPDNIAVLGKGIFMGCEALESVTLPTEVIRVSDNMFYGCKALKNVTLSAKTQSIGKNAFAKCSSLETIAFPDTLKSIEESVFSECTSLQKVALPEGFTTLGTRAFFSCESLEEITFPSTLTTIRESALEGCRALTTITFPESITKLPANVCYSCQALETVNLPSKLTEIGNNAFYGCSSLKSITIPASTTVIGEKAVGYGRWGSKVIGFTINGYANVETVVKYADKHNFKLNAVGYITEGTCGEKVTWNYNEEEKTLYIKGEGSTADYSSTDFIQYNLIPFEKIVIDEKITRIGNYAFYNAPAVDFAFNEKIAEIGEKAIGYYDKSGKPTLREGTSITGYDNSVAKTYADENKVKFNSLGKFVITEGKLSETISWTYDKDTMILTVSGTGEIADANIENLPFADYDIQSITVSDGITKIGKNVFCTNKPYASIELGKDIVEIGANAFGFTTAEKKDAEGKPTGETELVAIPDFVVRGYIVSPADEFAKHNKFTFEPFDSKDYPLFSFDIPSVIDHINKYIIVYQNKPDITAMMENFPTESFTEVVAPGKVATGNDFSLTNANNTYAYKMIVMGDCTGDGQINSGDALAVLQHAVKSALIEDPCKVKASDINHDGKINSGDALAMLQISVKLMNADATLDYGIVR
ncbi:MAG: leucine-rich repeat protein [Clostridia bacterium]|nr:leucine-rich repeat protein [Clostridia bacterium]